MPESLPPFLAFTPALMPRVWGGDRLAQIYPEATPLGPAPHGEAWLLSDHPQHESIIKGGPCDGLSLHTLTIRFRQPLLGPDTPLAQNRRFPLLLKLLDCKEPLSVQVHPDDATATALNEADGGKTEAWYILDAEPDSVVHIGIRPGTPPETFLQTAAHTRVANLLVQYPAPPGATFHLPAGLVHALGAGLLLAEIQQNSDITYRIDDWGRLGPDGKPRTLHLDKARHAIHWNAQLPPPASTTTFANNPYFTAEILTLTGTRPLPHSNKRCRILLPLTLQHATLTAQDQTTPLTPCHPVLIPASTADLQIQGNGTLLCFTAGPPRP